MYRLRISAKTIVNSLHKHLLKLKNNENYKALKRTILDDEYTRRTYRISMNFFQLADQFGSVPR